MNVRHQSCISLSEAEILAMINCPICGEYDFVEDSNFDVCNVCGWENDGVQLDDPDYSGGANKLSLNDYRTAWEKKNAAAM